MATPITIPTEPTGSIPRPIDLIQRVAKDSADPDLDSLYEAAIRDTIERFEATGSPVVTDGEQRKYHNFCTYCVLGLLSHCSDQPHIETPEEVRERSFEPGKNGAHRGRRLILN
jgi:hypothetical protein